MSRDPADYLTAYADGQLSPAGIAAVERALAERPDLRAELARIQALQQALRALPAMPAAQAPAALSGDARTDLLTRARFLWREPAPVRTRWRRRLLAYVMAAGFILCVAGILLPAMNMKREYARKSSGYHSDEARGDLGQAAASAYPSAPPPAPAAAPAPMGQPTGFVAVGGGGKGGMTDRLEAKADGSAMAFAGAAPPALAMQQQLAGAHGLAADNRVLSNASEPSNQPQEAMQLAAADDEAGEKRTTYNGRAGARKAEAFKDQETPVAKKALAKERESGEDVNPDRDLAEYAQRQRLDADQPLVAAKRSTAPATSAPRSLEAASSAARTKNKAQAAQRVAGEELAKSARDRQELRVADKRADRAQSFPGPELDTKVGAALSAPMEQAQQAAAQADATQELPYLPAQTPANLAGMLSNVVPSPLLDEEPALRLRNLVDNYTLPVQAAPDTQQRLFNGAGLPPAAGLSAGEQVVMLANRSGVQVVPAGGRLVFNTAPVALDPTDRLGLEPAAFASAFGTPPMAVVAQDPQLTFALDADTASYARARAELDAGRLPDPATVRPEQFVNAVPADYPQPTGGEAFALYAEAGPSPFARGALAGRTALVAVGVVGRAAAQDERKPLRLVLALDTSGSMARAGALDRALVAVDSLLGRLGADDRVAVVGFAERGRIIAPATAADAAVGQPALRAALRGVALGGATNTAEGLALACQVGREMADPDGELRVVLVTDGAAIAGADEAAARQRVAGLKAAGGSLLVLGVGERAADTRALDALTTAGDGQQLYLGSDDDARAAAAGPLLPERLTVLARDAKAQVTWNRERVTHARLVGYERRRLSHADFRNDRVDAGEIPAATVVTALFEVVLAEGGSGPLGSAAVRYLDTRRDAVRELSCPMPGGILQPQASPRLRTLACAAELAEQLRGSWWANIRPVSFPAIASACVGLPAPGDELARLANEAAALRPLPEVRP